MLAGRRGRRVVGAGKIRRMNEKKQEEWDRFFGAGMVLEEEEMLFLLLLLA